MRYDLTDFNGADSYFNGDGLPRWNELHSVLTNLVLQMQPSGQAAKSGLPIWDPKATNAELTNAATSFGWSAIPVPGQLREFGVGWDGGKDRVLVEYQFSNYPFLWNNIIRTEGVFRSRTLLKEMEPIEALVVVTKSGIFPASNSTLYYEQAQKQITAATSFSAFTVPIRLVGLTLENGTGTTSVDWNSYPERYGRKASSTLRQDVPVIWRGSGASQKVQIQLP